MRIHNISLSIIIAAATFQTAHAGVFTPVAFATGGAVGANSPDSLAFGSGSLWVAYTNGADSGGLSGSSLVVRYSPSGAVLKTFSITGSVDGLRIDPAGNVWALQNQDANSALTVINPSTNGTTSYTYGSTYTSGLNSTMRGFDEAAFTGGQTYLSVTNPSVGTDAVIVRMTSGLASPLQVSFGLAPSSFTGTNLATGQSSSTTITDPDSLKVTPAGDLALTGEGDKTIAFVHNIGAPSQSQSFISLLDVNSQPIAGKPDDTVFPNLDRGIFYVADTGANIVYALTATGLAANSVFVSEGNVFGSLDLATGIVTPVFTGTSPHGAEFVAAPEPASLALACGGLLLAAVGALWRRRR